MLQLSHVFLKYALGFYGLSCVAILVFPRRPWFGFALLPALVANAVSMGLRYHLAWPMLPMYLAPVALPFFLGILTLVSGTREPGHRVRRIVLALAFASALMAALFPKDFYVPFVKSQSVLAHAFLLFGVAGRSCFLVSAAWALSLLLPASSAIEHRLLAIDQRYFRWAVWGFSFWTLSMFAGVLWSYLGWGAPVVWDDPAITIVIATWFFYVGLLHLHFTGTWSGRGRAVYAALGAVVVLGLNATPDWGPFRWLW
ncbi:cytochrome c biogenesis protein CcsA [Desulfosoma sp.]